MRAVACRPEPRPISPASSSSQQTRSPRLFRDSTGLRALGALVRSRLRSGSGPPLRVWVPESATGEDAYSVAVCLFEALGRRWREVDLRVFSTDPDPGAVSRARLGRFSPSAASAVERGRRERFFTDEGNRLRVKPFVRSACRFVDHDLSRPAPFAALDLIAVRETLGALPRIGRRDALNLYHAALVPGGILLDPTGSAAEAPELFAPLGRAGAFSARPGVGRRSRRKTLLAPAVESRLLESEDRFRALFSQIRDALFLQDDESKTVILANAAAASLFGWSLPELLGMKADDLEGPSNAPARMAGERRSEDRLALPQYRRKDGTVFPADISDSFFMLHGRPCTLRMVRDAAPRLRARVSDRREEEQKAYVGDVIHELRSPLAIISGSAQTLRRGVKGFRAQSAILNFIESHTRRMGRLVDSLLNIGAAEGPKYGRKPTRVPLAAIVWEIVPAFIPLAKRRGITLKVDIAEALAVMADPADLPHLLGNLLDNAVKFTPRGGSVSVRGREEGGMGILSVTDSGRGIAPDDLTRVFERFYRCARTRKTKGSGLGLAIVRSIAVANHGGVTAENGPDGGAAFRVSLPLARR